MKNGIFLLCAFVGWGILPLFSVCKSCDDHCLQQVYMNGMMGVKTPPASPMNDGCGLIVTADFLYWSTREEALEFALNGEVLISSVRQNTKVKEPDFKWSPGFRVGLGYRIPFDFWETKAQWTRFHPDAHGESSNPNGLGNNPIWTDGYTWNPTANTQLITAKWDLDFDLLEVGLSRSFFLGKNLALDLHFGGVGGWIEQTYHMNCPSENNNGTIDNLSLNFTNRFRGGGVFAGFHPQWFVLDSLSLLGNFSAYLLHGTFDIYQNYHEDVAGLTDMSIRKDYSRNRAALHASLGLQWEICYRTFQFTLAAAYEGFIWFKQNLWSQVITFYMENLERRGDLQMQGLSLSGRIDF